MPNACYRITGSTGGRHLPTIPVLEPMELRVNPHEITIAAENSFVGLSNDGGKTRSHWASHWRVFWSEVGSGHALLLDTDLVEGPRVFTDNAELARFLQKQVECFLHAPFGDTSLPLSSATFERDGSPPSTTSESVRWNTGDAQLTWSGFWPPFNFATEPGYRGRPIGHQTTFFPANSASLRVNGKRASGSVWRDKRGEQTCTSSCLAWCETWYRPRGAA